MSIEEDQIGAAFLQSLTFRDLKEEDLKALISRFSIRTVKEKEEIITQGEKGDELFVVLDGQLEVVVNHPGTEISKTVRVLAKGDIVGEIAVLIDTRRTASVRSVTASKVAAISKDDFHNLLLESPTITLSLCQALGRAAATSFRLEAAVPFARMSQFPNASRHRALLPDKIIAACRAVPVARAGMQVTIAMVDAYDENSRRFLTQVINPLHPEFVAVSEEDFEMLAQKASASAETVSGKAKLPDVRIVGTHGELIPFEDSNVDRFLISVFQKAFINGATDIHFEPKPDRFQARIRIDGNLAEVSDFVSGEDERRAISRLKVMSDLDITKRQLPQDGSFALAFDGAVVDIRIACLAVRNGEKVALRLIPTEDKTHVGLNQFVENKVAATIIRDLFHQPSGLVLVTGPTGGGKTTTIYAGLAAIWDFSPVVNIVTIEDPIDRQLTFANQTQIDEEVGRTFPTVLKAVLRQDPDVILVGEIRDRQSASIALEAANTGHLVISSVHSHFAHQAISRLQSLDIPPYLIATALRGIVSQRLVRKICHECMRPLGQDEYDTNVKILQALGILSDDTRGIKLGDGCDSCGGSGERHRTALFEILQISDKLRAKLYHGEQITVDVLKEEPGHFLSMGDYAKFLLEKGVVSPRSALRAFPQTPGLMTGSY